jgi:hypothetical protein
MKRIFAPVIASLALASGAAAYAEQAPGPFPGRGDIVKKLNLDPERAAQVQQILANGRERMKAAHQQTMAELSQVLTPAELETLKQSMPQRPMRPQ